jgi:hypothetical protein
MRGDGVASVVVVASQGDVVRGGEYAVVLRAVEVAEAVDGAVVVAVRMEQLHSDPLTRRELHAAEEAHEAGLCVVDKHRTAHRQLTERHHRSRGGAGSSDATGERHT